MSDEWARFRILVVEDDDGMRKVLAELIQGNGATVFQAANGKEGLEHIEREAIDLVLSDVQMPTMGGVEMVKAIRAKNPTIPIVLLATGHSDITEEGALAIGAAGLIHKPFKIGILFGKIRELLSHLAGNLNAG